MKLHFHIKFQGFKFNNVARNAKENYFSRRCGIDTCNLKCIARGVLSSLWLYQTEVQTIQCVSLLMFFIKHVIIICNGFPLNAIPLFDVIGYVFPNLIFNINSNANTCAINIATHLTFKMLADNMLTIAELSHGKQRNYYSLSSKGFL